MGGNEDIVGTTGSQKATSTLKHVDLGTLDVSMQDIDSGNAFSLDEVLKRLPVTADCTFQKTTLEAIQQEVVPTDRQIVIITINHDASGSRTLPLQPHRIMRPVCTEFEHGRRTSFKPTQELLEAELFQWFMNPAIHDQDVAELSVVGMLASYRDSIPVVKDDVSFGIFVSGGGDTIND